MKTRIGQGQLGWEAESQGPRGQGGGAVATQTLRTLVK